MSPMVLMFVLLLGGLILLAGEVLLPAQGILGILGGACLLGAIGVGFWLNQWIGAGLLAAVLIASPFAATAAINLWPKTPFGKRIVLIPEPSHVTSPQITAGATGVAVTELRPAGEVEIDGRRLEASCDRGLVGAGSAVRVVGVIDGRVVVRPLNA
jgi:membrane-bound ClpP family serine protease